MARFAKIIAWQITEFISRSSWPETQAQSDCHASEFAAPDEVAPTATWALPDRHNQKTERCTPPDKFYRYSAFYESDGVT